jgi:hypothetical protein
MNPSGPGTNITLTAAVNGVPAADLPTGNIVFSANGTPFATNALVSGGISAGTASLPLGTNAVTAQYVGDRNFLGSTDSVAQVVQAPVVPGATNTLLGMVDNSDGTYADVRGHTASAVLGSGLLGLGSAHEQLGAVGGEHQHQRPVVLHGDEYGRAAVLSFNGGWSRSVIGYGCRAPAADARLPHRRLIRSENGKPLA